MSKTKSKPEAPMVMRDIKPYKSMIDGRMINSRSAHREHLREHGCIEIGNEKFSPVQTPLDHAKRKELIRAQVDSMSEREFKKALARDIEFIKWNSRK